MYKSRLLPEDYTEERHRLFVRNIAPGRVSFAPSNLLVLNIGCGVFVEDYWKEDVNFMRDTIARKLMACGHIVLEAIDR